MNVPPTSTARRVVLSAWLSEANALPQPDLLLSLCSLVCGNVGAPSVRADCQDRTLHRLAPLTLL